MSNSNAVQIPGGTSNDDDPTNELQELIWDGNTQQLSLSNGNSVNIPLQGGSAAKLIQDADGDTRIQVERTTNENRIRFYIKNNLIMMYSLSPTGHLLMETQDPGSNIFIGNSAGQKNNWFADSTKGKFNVFIGDLAGSQNVVGSKNTIVGRAAGKLNRREENVFLGFNCGPKVQEGSYNTFLGCEAGTHHTTGQFNVFLGNSAGGLSNASGLRNVFLGAFSGNNAPGNGNVFIGYQSGLAEKGDNKLYIHNNSTLQKSIMSITMEYQ